MPEIPTVSVDQLPTEALLLDVREDDEWAAGHVEGAIHVPMNSVPNRLSYDPGELQPDRRIYVMCKVGGRSSQVTAWLQHNGYDAVNVEGGMLAWAASNRPMVSDTGDTATVL